MPRKQLADAGLLLKRSMRLDGQRAQTGPAVHGAHRNSAAARQPVRTSNLGGCTARGIGIAIDDFGTGYASLTYLRKYPIESSRSTGASSPNTTTSDHDHRLVAGIIALATILDITVTAEGVERPAQAEHLRAMGCYGGQGFLFARALPAVEVEALFDTTFPLG